MMSTSYTVFDDASDVRNFLASRCRSGGHLMVAIGALVESVGGRFLSLTRVGVPSDRLRLFETGGLTLGIPVDRATGTGPSDECTRAVKQFLRETVGGAVAIENQVAKPGDGYLRQFGSDIVVKSDQVYHLITTISDADDEMRMRIMGGHAGWLFAIVLGDKRGLRSAIDAVGEAAVRQVDWRRAIREVWFDAYDGEGFVIWRPDWSGGR